MDTTSELTGVSGMEEISSSAGPVGYILFVLLEVMGVFILLGNGLTITAILTTQDLHTQASLYILNLAIADEIVGVAAFQWSFNYADFSRPAFDRWKYLCVMGYVLTTISVSQSLLTLALMAIDRLVFVEHPYFYVRCFTEKLVRRILACSWFFSLIYGSLIPLFHNDFSPEIGCVAFGVIDNDVHKYAAPIPGIIIMCITSVCYIRISCIARQHRQRIKAEIQSVESRQQQNTTCVSSSNKPASDRFKSTGLFLTINSVFALCWTPFTVYSLVNHLMPEKSRIAGFVTFLAMSNSGMNFVIYAWKNKQFSRAYKRLLNRCSCKQ